MNEPVDIQPMEGRQRAEDLRRLAAGEVTPEDLDQENHSFGLLPIFLTWI